MTAIIDKSSLIEKQPSPQTEKAAQGGLIGGEAFRYKLKVDSQHNKINNSIADNQPKKRELDRAGRAQLKHVLLDCNFKDKPKIIDLELTFKPISRLFLIDILAACSTATNAKISRKVCAYLGNRIGIDADSVEKILDYCIANDILWSVDGLITNSRVIKDQESYFKKLDSDRKRKESKRNPVGQRPDPDIDFDIDFDIDIDLKDPNKNGHAPTEAQPPPDSKFLEAAREALEAPDNPKLQSDNRFVLAGRRPMRKFPLIWLTEAELCDVLETYEKWGIPVDGQQIHLQAFKNVSSDLTTRLAENKNTKINAYTWLIGHEAQRLLDSLIKQVRLKREEIYLGKAHGN